MWSKGIWILYTGLQKGPRGPGFRTEKVRFAFRLHSNGATLETDVFALRIGVAKALKHGQIRSGSQKNSAHKEYVRHSIKALREAS